MIGRKIGRYRILSRLGAGGMSSVWEARDELLGHVVALKLLSEDLVDSADARRRFQHEAQIVALLDHPAIVPVFEAGEDGGQVWIAMALVDGETLATRVRRSLIPIAEALQVVATAGAALGYAHTRGVVHRDVTSGNIMLARDGRVLVLDFGLALARGVSRVSSSRTMVGTAAYMAPEVLKGAEADPRSDLFGLGVVMFEALTGALPFQGELPEVLAYAALHQPVRPPSELRSGITPAFDRVVLRLLAGDPQERYQNAEALLEDLKRLVVGGEVAPAPAPQDVPGVVDRRDHASAPIYLAMVPFAWRGPSGAAEPSLGEHARSLDESLAAALAAARRVHVIPIAAGPVADDVALRASARAAGANLVLTGSVRAAGGEVRATFSLVEVATGIGIGGGVVPGSTTDPFALEDALAARVRGALGLRPEPEAPPRRIAPHDPAAPERYQQAMRYLERHDQEASLDAAIGLLERLIASEGDAAPYRAALARAFLAKRTLTEEHVWLSRAADATLRSQQLDPAHPETLLALGDLHVASGGPGQAIPEYERAIAAHPERVEAHLGLSRALEAVGRSAEADQACRRAIAVDGSDWRGYQRLGMLLFRRGEYARAVEPWRRVIQITPDNVNGYRNLGSAYFHLDRSEDALTALREALRLQPNATGYTNLGTVLFSLGRADEACDAFEKSVALRSADPILWGNLGDACWHTDGRRERGREALVRAIDLMRLRIDNGSAGAEDEARFAGWLANLDRRAEALATIGRAVERDPENVHCLVAAGVVYFQLGDRERCLRSLEQAVRRGYGRGGLERSPVLRPLHSDPEFQRILRLGEAAGTAATDAPSGRGGS